MASRHDYARQATVYDDTRSASPSILAPLTAALAPAPGPRLLDIGGGTGNYAAALRGHGHNPVVTDVSEAMLSRARAKRLPVVRGDACYLPFATASADAVMIVSVLHLVPDWTSALAEARRVLRPGGVLTLMVYAREHLPVHWVLSYFPCSLARVWPEHQPLSELCATLPGCEVIPFEFTDLADASLSALCRWPLLLLDPTYRARTSYFERLARDDPAELESGLARLADDLKHGRRPDVEVEPLRRQVGDGAVLAWRQPLRSRTA